MTAAYPRTIIPFEVSSLESPGPLISKSQSGKVTFRSTQQIGRTWTEHYLLNVRSQNGRYLLGKVNDYWRNGTIFTIDHRDHLTPLGVGGGSPLVQAAPQLVTNPENFGAWSPSGTPVLTSGQSDPLGGTAAYLINDNDGAVIEYITTNPTFVFAGSGEKCVAVYMKQGSSDDSFIGLWDSTAGVARHQIRLDWTGIPDIAPTMTTTAGAGTKYNPEQVPAFPLWWRIPFTATGIVAGNVHYVQLGPTRAVAADTGTTYFFGCNVWEEVSPARYSGPSQALGTTGSNLYVNGGTASTQWLKVGDIFTIAGVTPVYEVTTDVITQANGYGIIPINPPIFTGGGPVDNAALTITNVVLQACILEPPTWPSTSGTSSDYGELVVKFSESL